MSFDHRSFGHSCCSIWKLRGFTDAPFTRTSVCRVHIEARVQETGSVPLGPAAGPTSRVKAADLRLHAAAGRICLGINSRAAPRGPILESTGLPLAGLQQLFWKVPERESHADLKALHLFNAA